MNIELSPLITAGASVAVAIITGGLTLWATKSKAKSDIQVTLNNGFGTLIQELQEELTEARRAIWEQRRRAEEAEDRERFLRRFAQRSGLELPAELQPESVPATPQIKRNEIT